MVTITLFQRIIGYETYSHDTFSLPFAYRLLFPLQSRYVVPDTITVGFSRMPWRQNMKKIRKHFILALMQSRFYAWLLLHVIPYIRLTTYYTSLRGWKYLRGYALLQPGDIILTLDRKKLTALLIPGNFSHAALCVDKGCEWEVSEMTHTNYTKSAFFDICKESDRVVILRCRDWDAEYISNVIAACKSFDHANYDIKFDFGVQALYCSELVYQSDFEQRLKINLDDIEGLGTQYISPDGLSKAKNCDWIWDSDKEAL